MEVGVTNTGFTSQQAADLTGASLRQLRYWRQTGLLFPSEKTPGGHARYNFQDLIVLRAVMQLVTSGVSLQRVRRSVQALKHYLPSVGQPLTSLTLVATGDVVLALQEGAAFEALSGQEWIMEVASFEQQVERWRGQGPQQLNLFKESKEETARVENELQPNRAKAW